MDGFALRQLALCRLSNVPPPPQCKMFINVLECWEHYDCSHLLYAPTGFVFAYCHNLVLSNDHNNLLFSVAVAEHFVFGFTLFVSSPLIWWAKYHQWLFLRRRKSFRYEFLVHLSHDILHILQTVCFSEVVRCCSFDIPQEYLSFRQMLHAD